MKAKNKAVAVGEYEKVQKGNDKNCEKDEARIGYMPNKNGQCQPTLRMAVKLQVDKIFR